MNTNIFDGTFLSAVANFNGDFIPISESGRQLFNEKEVGEMTHIEKVVNTLYRAKITEGQELTNKLCGVDLSTVSEEERDKHLEGLPEKVGSEELSQLRKINTEAKNYREVLWMLIRERISTDEPTLSLRPGFKIVSGCDEEDMMREMFSGFGSGIEVHVVKVSTHK